MFSKEEVYNATLDYFSGDTMRASIWMDKYALKNTLNQFLEKTPDDMHKRLAKEFARIELKYPNPLSYEEIYSYLKEFRYIIPGGSILYGAGNPYSVSSLGNCFVIGNNHDSIGGIFATGQEQAQLMKRRAGVGTDLSVFRPNFAPVTNAAGSSTGTQSWEELYSTITRIIGQNNRRGALMLSLDINHPDIEQFITSKDDLTKITGANISVKIDDDFMKAVENDEDYLLQFAYSDNTDVKYTFPIKKLVKARELWNKIIHQAWKSAEPGVLFWDTIKRESIPSYYGEEWKETSTNPCGEIPLCPYDSCRLLSVNLYSFVDNPFTDKATFNYDKFKDVVYKAQRFMDDIVDLEEEKINLILQKIEKDPEPDEIKAVERNLWNKIRTKLLEGRRTGLSSIGLADTFASLHCQYGSSDSQILAEEIYKQFAIAAYRSSIDMAKERGAFPLFLTSKEIDNPFIKRIMKEIYTNVDTDHWDRSVGYWGDPDFEEGYATYGRRNISCLTIPPSGTISMMAGISSGIEPVYQLYYKRRYKILENEAGVKKEFDFVDQNGDKWKEFIVLHPKFEEWMKLYVHPDDWEGEKAHAEDFVKESPYYKSTAYEIDPIQRVKLQGAIQKWIDHSISSTLNLPEDITEEKVSDIYITAWKEGLKGVTVYRNNSRTGVLVDIDKKKEEFHQHDAPKRPSTLPCVVHKTKSRGKEWLVIVGLFDGKPYEVFTIENKYNIQYSEITGEIVKVKKGRYDLNLLDELCIENFTENIPDSENLLTRMISTALRHGSSIQFIVEQLSKSEGDITSFGKATARILKRYIGEGTISTDTCPECGSKLHYEGGCNKCTACGFSKCG